MTTSNSSGAKKVKSPVVLVTAKVTVPVEEPNPNSKKKPAAIKVREYKQAMEWLLEVGNRLVSQAETESLVTTVVNFNLMDEGVRRALKHMTIGEQTKVTAALPSPDPYDATKPAASETKPEAKTEAKPAKKSSKKS